MCIHLLMIRMHSRCTTRSQSVDWMMHIQCIMTRNDYNKENRWIVYGYDV